MRKNFSISGYLVLIIIFLSVNVLPGQDGKEWKYLFDGETLDGWVQLGGTAKFEVEDGVIVGTTSLNTPNSFLCTKELYGNFILELDFLVDEGLNSGVQIRSRSLEDYKDGIVHGYQVEIDPALKEMYSKNPPNYCSTSEKVEPGTEPRSWTGGIYDEKRRGWLCDLTHNEEARNAFKHGQWNHFRIEAIGDGIRTWINDVPAASIVDFMTPNGFIGLQVHATEVETPMQVRWKNIRILDLGLNEDNPEIANPFIGDWQSSEGKYKAQVYISGEGVYKANLVTEFGSLEQPLTILSGKPAGENILELTGDKWTGKIEDKRLYLNKDSENYELRRFVRNSPTLNAAPPANAIVLFDGSNLDGWTKHAIKQWLVPNGPADLWKIVPGSRLEVVPGTGSIITKEQFGDFKLHVEFRLLGQNTNGGVYLQARYEINIKDSYGQIGGSPCGSLGNVSEPENLSPTVNAALAPLQWQTYDVDFRAPRFDESGKKIENARITLDFNGINIYKDMEVIKVKGAASRLGEAPKGPIYLQEHGTAYQFRNIWIVDKSK